MDRSVVITEVDTDRSLKTSITTQRIAGVPKDTMRLWCMGLPRLVLAYPENELDANDSGAPSPLPGSSHGSRGIDSGSGTATWDHSQISSCSTDGGRSYSTDGNRNWPIATSMPLLIPVFLPP